MSKILVLVLILAVNLLCKAAKKDGDDDGKSSPTVDQTMPDMAVLMSQCNETYNIEVSKLAN